jgi:hypothetical protein
MSNSYRIRTTPGVDKNINVLIDQEFEYLEILSLKILQSDVYSRPCSDYGVVVGRVSVNNGFGIPNAKISIFIPLTTEDESNPVISTLYPYKNLRTLNEDGYRYNLLPYKKSYSGHVPTGTFFTREDVLTDTTLIEVYDKYYRYTTTTNESGDFMIFGVPVGSQTIIADIDLSDIGEFSLSPQDLIRMGVATPNQVSGTKFKSSSNLNELPQIINIRKSIQVVPLWGQPDVCQLGISRKDFDLSSEAKIDINPTAIFMGSIISTSDEDYVKKNGKPTLKSGSLCSLTTGPGEILAIRQTIFQDSMGRPILETVDLEQGGQVIDENGTWLLDVPMNLDYVTTNEFGERVLSNDPKIGIPTKAKYRFKVKWNQSPSLSEPTKRGYFLVPNIKEYGWETSLTKPLEHYSPLPESNYQRAVKSYAFSLDWDDYGNTLKSNGQIDDVGIQMIQDAIDCKDTFYLMQYNKVYTVSQIIDQYRNGFLPERFTGIKDILNTECNGDVNKFPTNDTVFRFDLIFLVFYIFLFVIKPILIVLVPVIHILAFVIFLLGNILAVIFGVIKLVVQIICPIIQGLCDAVCGLTFGGFCPNLGCDSIIDGIDEAIDFLKNAWKKLLNIKIPNISYPECNLCECGDAGNLQNVPSSEGTGVDITTLQVSAESAGSSLLTQFQFAGNYVIPKKINGQTNAYYTIFGDSRTDIYKLFAGANLGNTISDNFTQKSRVPQIVGDGDYTHQQWWTTSLPLSEKLNLFNNKSKYFNEDSSLNPGGGVNRIKVTFATDLNNSSTKFHYDNVLALVFQDSAKNILKPGQIISFQAPSKSKDINLKGTVGVNNQFGTTSITGSPINYSLNNFLPPPYTADTAYVNSGSNLSIIVNTILKPQMSPAVINLEYADFNNPGINIPVNYDIYQDIGVKVKKLPKIPHQPQQSQVSLVYTGNNYYSKYAMDVEYFQVVTAMTYNQYSGMCNNSATTPIWNNKTLFRRFLNNSMDITHSTYTNPCGYGFLDIGHSYIRPIQQFNKYEKQIVTFLVRGVDPNSSRQKCSYDLSILFGFNIGSGPVVTGDYKLNQPIKGGYRNIKHNGVLTNISVDSYSNQSLYYDSFSFSAATGGSFSFTSFTSNLISYYSELDNNRLSFQPGDDPNNLYFLSNSINVTGDNVSRIRPFSASYTTNVPCERVKGRNGFISYWAYYTDVNVSDNGYCPVPMLTPQSPSSYFTPVNRVQGYYPKEIVEGGSVMYQDIDFWYSDPGANDFCGSDKTNHPISNSMIGVYFAPKYSSGTTITFTDANKMVMRSDRLPTSTTTQDNINNSFPLHTNSNFAIYQIADSGDITELINNGSGPGLSNPGVNTDIISGATNPIPTSINTAIESFGCGNMAPLGCYNNSSTGEFSVKPKSDGCWRAPGGGQLFDGGCYILITTMFESLFRDIELVVEWVARIQVIFGACRDVWSHTFSNNWINGTLYAFSFKNYVTYDNNNKPQHTFCSDIVMLHPTTNNFYYRSSPFSADGTGGGDFVGADYHNHAGNWNQTLYPTTLLDMGPRNDFIQELVMSDDYDGYVVNKLGTTTYGDVTELLNLFIISRLTSTSFLEELVGIQGASIFSYFSRANLFGDADYSQAISINSELGVAPFEANNYLDLGTVQVYNNVTNTYSPLNLQDPIYVEPNADSGKIVFGVFFDSDSQVRDFITPKRTILNPNNGLINSVCSFNNFNVFNQEVPFYQWTILPAASIFGTQENDWDTGTVPFLNRKYQELKREDPTSKYFRTNNQTRLSNYKGYIYSVSGPITINEGTQALPYLVDIMNYNPSQYSWQQNNGDFNSQSVLTGAPFHFYFGLKTGKSAFDRFAVKWLDTTTTIY